ncbi:hypothetical protein NC651_029568 [Populus alba x Populus x berolinensis]|nr:hypothetical protein NC651_029568 [Populus alba x Populus x berolinensis]
MKTITTTKFAMSRPKSGGGDGGGVGGLGFEDWAAAAVVEEGAGGNDIDKGERGERRGAGEKK